MFKKWCCISALVSSCVFTSCDLVTDVVPVQEQADTGATRVYTIRAGAHYSDTNLLHRKEATNHLRFTVLFDSTAIYQTADPGNQGDINKLYGLSDCNDQHHTNSARFGWRWYNNQLELHAYTYRNKSRKSAYLGAVPLGKTAICEIKLESKQYVFVMNGKTVSLPRACSGAGEGYQLYPYFGGDEPAPHDVTITIQELPAVSI